MSEDGKRSIGQSIRGADRPFRLIDGGAGGSGGGPSSAEPKEDDPSPVQSLGHLDGQLHFLDVKGQKRALSARALASRSDLLLLFHGDEDWLRGRFPRWATVEEIVDGEKVQVKKIVDFSINRAAAWFMAACGRAGLFGDHVVLRRSGIWTDDDGRPVVHCGDQVLIGTEWFPAGTRRGNHVWAAAPVTPRPSTPCEAAVVTKLQLSIRDLWNFREPGGEIVVLGLIANAYYGAAPRWRPNGFLTGGAGSGKSTLLKFMRAACPIHHYSNDTSKAGVEQSVNGRAMPSFLDETSDRADQDGARALLDLVLSASGDEGTKGHRGGVDGRVRTIEIVGCIIMATINPPDMKPQHQARFTLIDLKAAEPGADHRAAHEHLVQETRKAAPAIWGRALAGWDRYCSALGVFRAALSRAGCAPREMDHVGALLAGWWVLVREGVPDDRGAREGVGALKGFTRLAEEVTDGDGPRRMLQHLLATLVQLHRSTDRDPIAKLIEIAFGVNDDEGGRTWTSCAELLENYGIRIIRETDINDRQNRPVPRLGPGDGLWFSSSNPELKALFRGTDFEGDRWRSEMLRLETARVSKKTIRIGRMATKAVWVSRSDLNLHQTWEPP